MVTCESYMHEFSVSENMKKIFNNDKKRKEVAVGKVTAHLNLTLIIKKIKFNVE
jgi:hypothetical protein